MSRFGFAADLSSARVVLRDGAVAVEDISIMRVIRLGDCEVTTSPEEKPDILLAEQDGWNRPDAGKLMAD